MTTSSFQVLEINMFALGKLLWIKSFYRVCLEKIYTHVIQRQCANRHRYITMVQDLFEFGTRP